MSGDATVLTYWGRVAHICVSKLTIIGSYNGLLPGRRQAIIWTSAGILLIGPLVTTFSEILIEIHIFNSHKYVVWKMLTILSRPQCVKTQSMQESSSVRADPFPSTWGESSLQCATARIRVYNRFLPSLWHRESILIKLTDFRHTVDLLIKTVDGWVVVVIGMLVLNEVWRHIHRRLLFNEWCPSETHLNFKSCDISFHRNLWHDRQIVLKFCTERDSVLYKISKWLDNWNWCFKWTIFREIWV